MKQVNEASTGGPRFRVLSVAGVRSGSAGSEPEEVTGGEQLQASPASTPLVPPHCTPP